MVSTSNSHFTPLTYFLLCTNIHSQLLLIQPPTVNTNIITTSTTANEEQLTILSLVTNVLSVEHLQGTLQQTVDIGPFCTGSEAGKTQRTYRTSSLDQTMICSLLSAFSWGHRYWRW